LIRRVRVSSCLAEVIQWIQSLRAMGVMSEPQRPRNEPEISACARGEFEACLEEERI